MHSGSNHSQRRAATSAGGNPSLWCAALASDHLPVRICLTRVPLGGPAFCRRFSCCAAGCRLPDGCAGHENRQCANSGTIAHTSPPFGPCTQDRRYQIDQGRGKPAYRGGHHSLLFAGSTGRSIRPGPHRPQSEDALRHRPLPGRAAWPGRRLPSRAGRREPNRQPGFL